MKSTVTTMRVAEWCPDQPVLRLHDEPSGVSDTIVNVLPRSDRSYGAFKDFVPMTMVALPENPRGAYFGNDPGGNYAVFCGTTHDLWKIQSGQTGFTNVSKSAGVYGCPLDSQWSFTQFNSRVIACNIVDPVQTFVMGTDSHFSDLGTTTSTIPPKARYCAVAKNFLFLANTNDPVGGPAPWRAWWSGINQPDYFPTPGSTAAVTVQSDYNDFAGPNGQITGIVGNLGTADIAIFQEHAVWRGYYVGPSSVFNFFPAEGVRGTSAPGSIVQLGSLVYYLGEDGFYAFDGTQSVPIGLNKVDRTFLTDLNPGMYPYISAAIDPLNKIVMWAYVSNRAPAGSTDADTVICYNWATQRWSKAFVDVEFVFRSVAFGYTLDGLDATGYNLDTLPFSLDSRVWNGGGLLLGGFQNGKLGYFTGANLAASIRTEELQPLPGSHTFVRNTRPLINLDPRAIPPTSIPLITVTPSVRDHLMMAQTQTTPGVTNYNGWAPLRCSGRYVQFQIDVPYNTPFDNLQGLLIDSNPLGTRR